MKPELKDLVVNSQKSKFDVYVGRAWAGHPESKWGNPFPLHFGTTRKKVVRDFAKWLKTQPHLIEALPELKGKVLGCWCAPQLCHGHVLVQLTEAEDVMTELDRIIEGLS